MAVECHAPYIAGNQHSMGHSRWMETAKPASVKQTVNSSVRMPRCRRGVYGQVTDAPNCCPSSHLQPRCSTETSSQRTFWPTQIASSRSVTLGWHGQVRMEVHARGCAWMWTAWSACRPHVGSLQLRGCICGRIWNLDPCLSDSRRTAGGYQLYVPACSL